MKVTRAQPLTRSAPGAPWENSGKADGPLLLMSLTAVLEGKGHLRCLLTPLPVGFTASGGHTHLMETADGLAYLVAVEEAP